MIDQTEGAELLEPLAEATLDAYGQARRDSDLLRVGLEAQRAILEPSALALCDGINFWSYWSAHLSRRFEEVASIRRSLGHPLEHVWIVADTIQLRLKSDVYALGPVQRSLPGLAQHSGGFVALSAPVTGELPFFVGMHLGKVAWRIPVASLAVSAPTPLSAARPKASMRLRRPPEEGEIAR